MALSTIGGDYFYETVATCCDMECIITYLTIG